MHQCIIEDSGLLQSYPASCVIQNDLPRKLRNQKVLKLRDGRIVVLQALWSLHGKVQGTEP